MAIASFVSKDKKNRKRKGRGNASGMGGECGRGHKGQKSRSGYSRMAGFEGGQTPLYRRLPKLNGFNNLRFKTKYDIINISDLNRLKNEAEINVDLLVRHNIVSGKYHVKLLANGSIDFPVQIHVHAASASAIKKIKTANGEVVFIDPSHESIT